MPRPRILCVLTMLHITLAACQPVALPQIFQPLPPTPVPTPTPTRANETVIPFKTLATNQVGEIPLSAGGVPVLKTYDTPDFTSEEMPALLDLQPALYVATSPDELSRFLEWLTPETRALLNEVDYTQNVVLAFFLGFWGGGCGGYIQRVAASQMDTLFVYGIMRSCTMTTADDKWPSHIVQVRRDHVSFPITSETQVVFETSID